MGVAPSAGDSKEPALSPSKGGSAPFGGGLADTPKPTFERVSRKLRTAVSSAEGDVMSVAPFAGDSKGAVPPLAGVLGVSPKPRYRLSNRHNAATLV